MSAPPDARAARRMRPRPGFVLGNVVGLLLATATAATALWPVYRSDAFLVLVAVTFALGAGIATLGATLRWPAWLVGLVTVAVYFLAGVPLAIPGQAVSRVLPSPAGMLELAVAAALSWKRLVTIVLPVGSYQALLVPAFILVLLSTVIGLSIALRSRIGELAALAPAALYLAGIGFGPTVAVAPIETGLALFVVLLFWMLWLRAVRRRALVGLVALRSHGTGGSAADRRISVARGLVSAALVIAVASAAGTAAALALPVAAPRDVLRARVQQPFDPHDYASPLSEFRSYLQPGRAGQALLQVTGLPSGGRIRLATLDSYNGIVYSVGSDTVDSASGQFSRLPDRLDQSAVTGDRLALTVTVAGYTGVWVPGAGQLEQIAFTGPTASARSDGFFYNDTSGTGAVLGGLSRGDRYSSVSVVPRAAATLATLRPGTAALPPAGAPNDALDKALAGYVRAGDPSGVQLQAMLDGLKTDGYVSHGVGVAEPASRSGHGADRIRQLFTDQPMLGDAEQYSVAAALMARRLGFPARVVIGFAPPAGRSGPVTITGSDISAWIEVKSAATGWVTIDPNPPVRDIPAKRPDQPTVVSRPQSVVPPSLPDTAEQRDPAPPESATGKPPTPADPILALLLAAAAVAGWSLLGLVVGLGPFALIIAAKARRRLLRRSRSTPLDRIRGGWREFADTAVDFGVALPVGATRSEFAESVGGSRPLVLATAVDRAVFSPDRPGDSQADEIWRVVMDLRRGLAIGKKRGHRLKALVSLRSFGRYAGGTGGRWKRGAGS